MPFERELELAKSMTQEAGFLALDYQRRGVTAETKYDESPVTAADRACEKLIVEQIARHFPDDGVLGEEGANKKTPNGRRWIVDPIDGTRDFVRGIPLWSVLIGFEQDGQVVAGAAHCPGQGMLVIASKGFGTWLNGTQIRVSSHTDASQAVLCFNGFHKSGVKRFSATMVDWLTQFWAVRSLGGSMDAMLLAQGHADLWVEPSAAPWDLAALKIIVEEAGGKFSSFAGRSTIYDGDAYACTPGLEHAIQQLLDASAAIPTGAQQNV